MTSPELEKARTYEETEEKKIASDARPAYHLTPRAGWMNDPNGFTFYKGQWHLFYQYYPYQCVWGPMHWGHAVSRDLLHWEYRPAALAPDEGYDRAGCFSGSAAVLPDGRLMLMYTGVHKEELPDGESADIQTQCLALGDGTEFEKYEGNPVLDASVLPKGSSRKDFRDPKIWQEKDGTYFCVIGNRPADGSGQILLFNSPDGIGWNFKSVLAENKNRFGKMWECPDFFELDGKWVLLTSPQDMLTDGKGYHNGNGTLCLIGNYDAEEGHFSEEMNQPIDFGLDFYATQTHVAPDGRRIMIGWMQNWDSVSLRMEDAGWFGQMSLPRELSVKDGRLIQQPIREINALRTNEVIYENEVITGVKSFPKVSGRKADIELTIDFKAERKQVLDEEAAQAVSGGKEADPASGEKTVQTVTGGDAQATSGNDGGYSCRRFEFRFAKDDHYYSSISYKTADSMLRIDRTFSGSRRDVIHHRKCRTELKDGILKLRILLDLYSVEVFVNDGSQTVSAVLYTDPSADQISFIADGTAAVDIRKYDLAEKI